jgi:hypothetical protein
LEEGAHAAVEDGEVGLKECTEVHILSNLLFFL